LPLGSSAEGHNVVYIHLVSINEDRYGICYNSHENGTFGPVLVMDTPTDTCVGAKQRVKVSYGQETLRWNRNTVTQEDSGFECDSSL